MNRNLATLRALLPHVAMAAAPIGLIALFFNAPLRAELAQTRARLTTLHRCLEAADPGAPSPLVLADAIRALGGSASSSPVIYDAISAAARRRHVTLESINPTTPQPPSAEDPAPRNAHAFSIVAQASFENLLAFVSDLESSAGFSAVRSLRIEPVRADAPHLLQAVIETNHTNYTLSTKRADSEDER